MRLASFRLGLLASALLLAASVSLIGCAPAPQEESIEEVCAEPIIVSCDGDDLSMVVVVAGDAPDDQVTALTRRLHASGTSSELQSMALRREVSDAPVLDAEIAPPAAWEVTVLPGQLTQVETTLTGILAAAAVPGAFDIGVASGWPYVTVDRLDRFEDVFTQVSATPLFHGGGTYTLLSADEHLRVVHVPDRTTDAAILEIIDIARDYPEAEVLLEAPTAGPQFPALYVSRLTPEQATELDTRLRAPELADADVDGYALEYVLGSLGESGVTYIGGTFGAVPTE